MAIGGPEDFFKLLGAAGLKDKRALEIGLGYGSLSQKMAEAGAGYTGLDIAAGPVGRKHPASTPPPFPQDLADVGRIRWGACYVARLRIPEHPERRFRSILNIDSGGS